ncbi:MAG: glycoside hydrolase family 97 catalytic domain-containing protein [Bacteroidota bacterium]|nr:glycoside hydrolase family 97 catalytic domain-containing protein [Bacteroidota bacterium]
MKKRFNLYLSGSLALLTLITGCSHHETTSVISSPSGIISASVYADSSNRLSYSVQYQGKTLVASSALGITVNQNDLGQGVDIGSPDISTADEQYPWTGVHAVAHNHFREAVFPITHRSSGIHYQLEIKAFDDGFAFRYVVPAKGVSVVHGEASSWKIPGGSTVWYQENIFYYEGLYYSAPAGRLGSKRMGPPLTYQTGDSLYASITEAALYNYSGMSLQSDSSGILHAAFVNDPQGWKIRDTIVTPWRVLIAGSTLNELVNSDIIPDLNPAPDSSLQNATWIKPGRAVWSYFMHDNVTSLGLEKTYVDKAGLLGFEYSVVDAGWQQSWPSSMDSLKSLVDYARPKKVGIWVWTSYAALKEDSIRRHFFKALHEAGVAGAKIDFIDTESFERIRFYENALKDAAAERLMVDFHGADKPTGYNRRYPNELTREAIYGQEWRTYNPQGPANNATIPFTRFLAGPGDCTPGVFNSKKAYGTSRAQQLALPIIYNSPLACWPDDPDVYLASAALPIIKAIPTTWDETRVLEPSRIGHLAVFARRKGSDWFIAVANAGDEKRFSIPLGFLGNGKFKADLVRDDLTDPDSFLYSQSVFTRSDSLLVVARPAGGFVAMLRETTDQGSPALSIYPEGGYLYAPIPVTMKTNAGFSIRYTTDGSKPSLHSVLYTQPVTVKDPVMIRAGVFHENQPQELVGVAQFLAAPAPRLSVPAGIFINQQTVRLDAGQPKADIHYTTDGSSPGLSSPVYKDPLLLSKTTVLKAATFYASGIRSAVNTANFRKAIPAPATAVQQINSGLSAIYYEGQWIKMPDFKKISGIKTSVAALPDLDLLQTRKNYYAVQFTGYIKIPVTGVYSFYINSDDGSQLYLDDQKLIDNDGCHGDLEKSGEKALAAGMHRFTVNYFQNASGQTLQVYMKAPGFEKQAVPASMFFH